MKIKSQSVAVPLDLSPKIGGTISEMVKVLGFPIVVALWFMLSFSPKMDKLIELNTKIVTILEKHP